MPFRRIARPLLAAVFVANGVDTLLHPKPKVDAAKQLMDKAHEVAPSAPTVDPVLFVQAEGALKVGAGLLMALGRAPRLSAAVLAVDLIPNTAVEHPFWTGEYPDERATQRTQFLKNLGLLGGLLLAITDTGGKPSLAWRAKQAKRDAKKAAKNVRRDARKGVEQASRRTRRQAERAARRARERTELALS